MWKFRSKSVKFPEIQNQEMSTLKLNGIVVVHALPQPLNIIEWISFHSMLIFKPELPFKNMESHSTTFFFCIILEYSYDIENFYTNHNSTVQFYIVEISQSISPNIKNVNMKI